MVILSPAIYERRRRLLKDRDAGRIAPEDFYSELIDLDPNDFVALTGAGRLAWERGDLTLAEEYFWKAIDANPAAGAAYLELGRLLQERGDEALASGVGELSILKLVHSGNDFEDVIDAVTARLGEEASQAIAAMPSEERTGLFLAAMEAAREQEPAAVTEKLRTLRLIDQLQEEEDLSAETVDAIVAEGRAVAPLLIGMLRAWTQEYLGDEEEHAMENAAALLGEVGSTEELPPLLELMPLENETAAGVASWAVSRIVERAPDAARSYFEGTLDELDMVGLVKIAGIAVHSPKFDPWAKLLELVGDRWKVVEKENRPEFFYLLIFAMAARGRAGIDRAREMIRRNGSSLPSKVRAGCDDLLEALEEGHSPGPPPPAFPYTIYEICAGEASWEVEDNEDSLDDELPEQPVRVRPVPGRNDLCWCGSGKKYKKCHLDTDANRSLE